MNQYNSARAAGYSETYSRQACRIEKLVKVSLADKFEQKGLTDNAIADFALNGMNNATKLFGKDAIEHPDWQSKHKFFETICKMTGRITEQVKHSGIPQTQVHVHPNKTYVFTSDSNEIGAREFVRGLVGDKIKDGITDTE